MCGFQDFIQPIVDMAATATGNPELIPLLNAGISTGEGLASGKGLGKSLESGLISGGESLAGQEVAGAFGIGGGNSFVNDALGIDISPAATGLPDVGAGIQDALGLGSSGSPSVGTSTGSPVVNAGQPNANFLSGSGSASPIGGGVAGAPAAPASISGPEVGGGDVTFDPSSFTPSAGSGGINAGIASNLTTAPSTGGGFSSGSSPSSFVSGGGSAIGGGTSALDNALSAVPDPSSALNSGQGPTKANADKLPSTDTPSSIFTAFSNPTLGNIGKALGNNAGLLASGAGLLNDFVNSGPIPGEKQLKGQAANLGGQGQQLQQYINTGTLPPGVQGGINQALASAKAAIKSKYASMGMSGSSAEQQDIANAEQSAATQGANIAMSLLQQGVQETQLSSQIYQELINNTMANDKAFSESLTNLGSAIAGGSGHGGGTTIRIGGG